MTVEFAIAYIPMRMRELGYEDRYIIRWRHIYLDGNETKNIVANNEFYYLIQPTNTIVVKSKFGIYDQKAQNINELQYEHRGHISVKNTISTAQWVLFIQAIPRHPQRT